MSVAPPQNVVIRASAGSGKTFQLTNRYLTLIFSGVSPKTILAATFTRKAAGEILDRILSRLASAALTDEGCAKLSRELYGNSGFLNRPEVCRLLAKLAAELHQLRISTLDSFFSRLAGIFSLETGLPIGWRIVDDATDARYLNRAILTAFSDPERNDIPRLLHLLFKGEIGRSLSREIYDLVRELIDLYRQTDEKDWSKLPKFPPLSDEEKLEAIRLLTETAGPTNKDGQTPHRKFQAGVSSLIRTFQDKNWIDVCKSGLIRNVLSGIDSYCNKEIPSGIKTGIEKIVREVRAVVLNQIADQTKATREVLARIAGYYDEIKMEEGGLRFDDLTQRLADRSRLWELGQVTHRLDSQTTHLLLDEFQDTSLLQWNVLRPMADFVTSHSDVMNASDSMGAMDAMDAADGPNPFHAAAAPSSDSASPTVLAGQPQSEILYSREDSLPARVYKTSFSDLPEACSGSFFCVGDVKQAIYRWRGGMAEIFDEIEKTLPVQLNHLDRNWRSSPTIIETVNAFFHQIAANPVFQTPPKESANSYVKRRYKSFLQAAEAWQDRFELHQTAPVNRNLPGFVTLESAPLFDPDAADDRLRVFDDDDLGNDMGENDEEEGNGSATDQKKTTLSYAVRRIVSIHRRIPGASIGVLVRTNKLVGQIVVGLAKFGIEASQEGGVPLSSAMSVRALLSILTLADHPGDSIALFHLASLKPFSDHFGITPDNVTDSPLGRKLSFRIRERIMTVGLGRFVWEMSRLLFPLCDDREVGKLRSLSELAFQFESENELRLDRFIERVEKTKLETPSASHVHVMSIHRSKGLEFDVVVLPELDGTMVSSREKVIIHRPAPTQPIDAVLRRVGSEQQAFLPPLYQNAVDDEWTAQTEEALNLLYVAMTRAVHELVMIVSPSKSESYGGKSFANLLRAALTSSSADASSPPSERRRRSEEILFQSGDPNWFRKTDGPENVSSETAGLLPSRRFEAASASVAPFKTLLPPLPPSKKGFRRQWRSQRRFVRGSAIHHCFEQIGWLDDGLPSRGELRQLLSSPSFDKTRIDEMIDDFLMMCNQPRTAALLTRKTYQSGNETPVHAEGIANPTWEVFRERAFLLSKRPVGGRSGVVRGTIDRLVLLNDSSRIVGADIIDFKTDRGIDFHSAENETDEPPEEFGPEITPYVRQLAEYRRIVAKFFSLPMTAISTRLAFVSSDFVLNVPFSPGKENVSKRGAP